MGGGLGATPLYKKKGEQMKYFFFLITAFYFYGCATLPPLEKIEYSGPDLEVSNDYEIKQMEGVSETIFMVSSPQNENVLLNIYKVDGTLVGTLYQGKGGVFMISLAIIASKYDFNLSSGEYLMVLYGANGTAGFKLKVL